MDRRLTIAASPRRPGFTLVEVMLVSGLMAFLAILLSSAWSGIGRSAVDVTARSQLLQELDLAVASLSRDLGGSLPIPSSLSGDYGGIDVGALVGCRPNDLSDQLELCYDAGPDPNGRPDWQSDTIVRYYLDPDPDENVSTKILVRSHDTAGTTTTFTVARCVASLSVSVTPDEEWIVVELTFTHPHPRAEHTRKCTLKSRIPQ
ncbi:MAG: type II secretion system GspH family protein [Planctomycetes bacterium]|nr:type II secretion system GspH family protein [Planctomycetota bacterium]MBU4399874.1 type II secretion system GspH family protein [Planctomycetota bacterium]MCG2682669.1 type II secretion system GspH family protein [Planctomycetales bacterium]